MNATAFANAVEVFRRSAFASKPDAAAPVKKMIMDKVRLIITIQRCPSRRG
jgi:hypothetical protein